MKPISEAFLDQDKWNEFDFSDTDIDLGQEIFEGANFADQHFEALIARGCTFKNCYFTRCNFLNCDLSSTEFSGCTLEECVFVNCTFGNLILDHTRCSPTKFNYCSADAVRIQGGKFSDVMLHCSSVAQINCSDVTELSISVEESKDLAISIRESGAILSLEQCQNIELTAANSASEISAYSTAFRYLLLDSCAGSSLKLRDCEVASADLKGPEKKLVMHCHNSFIINIDLSKVDLSRSAFPGCSIVEGQWPNQVGKTNLFGRFVAPDKLLSEPVEDIMGLPDTVRRNIARSQALASLEEEKTKSTATFALHRVVGLTTGHGRSPTRLVGFSILPAIILAIFHLLYLKWFGPIAAIIEPSSFLEFVNVCKMYFSLVIGYGDRTALPLIPTLESVAWVFSVLFLGLVVTLFSNFIFRQG